MDEFYKVSGGLALNLFIFVVNTFTVWCLWDIVMVPALHLPTLSFFQVMGLKAMINLLVPQCNKS